ncbi:MAG TPA: aldo/keto reductase [Nitrososphaeraceae archaeon]|nr:aldo/keto reductase [Nitrososphaeraceae archaeon]
MSYIDLYLIHWPVQGLGDETWRSMIKLWRQSKAHTIGVSNYSIRELKELLLSSSF